MRVNKQLPANVPEPTRKFCRATQRSECHHGGQRMSFDSRLVTPFPNDNMLNHSPAIHADLNLQDALERRIPEYSSFSPHQNLQGQ